MFVIVQLLFYPTNPMRPEGPGERVAERAKQATALDIRAQHQPPGGAPSAAGKTHFSSEASQNLFIRYKIFVDNFPESPTIF